MLKVGFKHSKSESRNEIPSPEAFKLFFIINIFMSVPIKSKPVISLMWEK